MAQLWPEQIDGDTIGKGLKRIGFARKSDAGERAPRQKTYAYRERDAAKRSGFIAQIADLDGH